MITSLNSEILLILILESHNPYLNNSGLTDSFNTIPALQLQIKQEYQYLKYRPWIMH